MSSIEVISILMRESSIFKGEKAPLLFGHRGCPKLAPENSISSFKKIIENKIPGVELDLQLCKTGELVVCHDTNLKRLTGYNKNIPDCDLSEIRPLDYGSHFSSKYKNEKIPLFHEVLELLGDKVYYDIEIKSVYVKNMNIEKQILSLINDFSLENRVLISSFNPISLRRFKTLSKNIQTSLIYSDSKEVPCYLRKGEGRFLIKNSIIKPDCNLLTEKLFKKLNKRQKIMTWTVDDEKLFKKMKDMGVSGICSNRAEYFT